MKNYNSALSMLSDAVLLGFDKSDIDKLARIATGMLERILEEING